VSRPQPVVVSGVSGFFGRGVAMRPLDHGEAVIGVDNFNDDYDQSLKEARVATLGARGVRLERIDIADAGSLAAVMQASGAPQGVQPAPFVRALFEKPLDHRPRIRPDVHPLQGQRHVGA
jgi:UDP-glucuronate 4-epimerase